MNIESTHREIAFIFTYSGKAESWEEIKDDAKNNKIKSVFIGTKEFVNVIRCKDCKHRPIVPNYYEIGSDLEFPDIICPCQCDDSFYSYVPNDNWFCPNGER